MKSQQLCLAVLFLFYSVNGAPRSFIETACERLPSLTACSSRSASSSSSSQSQAQADNGPQPTPSPLSKQKRDYCFKNNAAYQQFCQQGLQGVKLAYDFCVYYYQNCPGANPPGSGSAPTTTPPPTMPTTPPPTPAPTPAPTTKPPCKGKKCKSTPAPGGAPPAGGGAPPAGGGAPPAGGGAPPAGGGAPPAGGAPGAGGAAPAGGAGGQPLAGLGAQAPVQQFGGNVPGGLGIGQSLNSPFFGASSGTNVVPTKGVMTGTNINAAGVGVGQSQGVDFSGLPFMSNLNQGLGVPGGGMPGLGSFGSFGGIGRKRRNVNSFEDLRRKRQNYVLL